MPGPPRPPGGRVPRGAASAAPGRVFPSCGGVVRAGLPGLVVRKAGLTGGRRSPSLAGGGPASGMGMRRAVPGGPAAGTGRAREGHLVDALASRGDEGRGTLRKAPGSREQAVIRGSPNGATHPATGTGRRIHRRPGRTRGTETSQYPEERTSTETPSVAASERGPGQWPKAQNRKGMESPPTAGDRPVRVERPSVLE